MATYDPKEQDDVLQTFVEMLGEVTKDGGRKRAAGLKPPWQRDRHRNALFRHLWRWQEGEKVDKDSGAHPLVHVAWRALAIAWQETNGVVLENAGWKRKPEHNYGNRMVER